jgi:hypothetical protein
VESKYIQALSDGQTNFCILSAIYGIDNAPVLTALLPTTSQAGAFFYTGRLVNLFVKR